MAKLAEDLGDAKGGNSGVGQPGPWRASDLSLLCPGQAEGSGGLGPPNSIR